MNIQDYTLSEDIKDYANLENISAFSNGDKKIEEVESKLSGLDIKDVDDINSKLLSILDSNFELINYDENLINDLISYYFYLKIVEDEKRKEVEEDANKELEKQEKNQDKLYNSIISNYFMLEKFHSKLLLKEGINTDNFRKNITNLDDKHFKVLLKRVKGVGEYFLIKVDSIGLNIMKYIFLEGLLNNKKNYYFKKLNYPQNTRLVKKLKSLNDNVDLLKKDEYNIMNGNERKKDINEFLVEHFKTKSRIYLRDFKEYYSINDANASKIVNDLITQGYLKLNKEEAFSSKIRSGLINYYTLIKKFDNEKRS